MKIKKYFPAAISGPVVGVVLAVALGWSLQYFSFGRWLAELSYDLPFVAREHLRPTEVVTIYMDEESHKELNQPLNLPWDRSVHARLLDRLTAAGARAVVFDIVFSDPGPNPAADLDFARAIRKNGRVVLAADVVPTFQAAGLPPAKMILPPIEHFSTNAAAVGSAEVDPGRDLIIRRSLQHSHDDLIFGLSWSAATVAGAPITGDTNAPFSERWLNYYGPPDTVKNIRYFEALLPETPLAVFSNKVVFVGARLKTKFSGDRKDEYRTPYSFWSKENIFISGVEIQATGFLNLLRGDWLVRSPPLIEKLVITLAGILFGIVLVRHRPAMAIGISLLSIVVIAVANYLIFVHLRAWFPWMILVAQICVVLLWSIVFNSIQLYVQNKLYEQSLSRYLSPKLVKKLSRAKDRTLSEPGAAKQMLTVIFSDIANFTAISEYLDSDELAKWMNNYFERSVNECIHRTDGTVVKYIGDAIFAFWNAPENQSDHAHRACVAALHFRDQGVQYINGQPVYTRIGLHTGEANVGNFGSTTRIDYTAFGANINLASRMEGLNKYLGTQVLITGDTQKEIGDALVLRPLGKFRLKGFEKSVDVYELLDELDKAARTQPLRDAFAAALKLFHQREWDGAEAAFKRVLEISADDGPSKFYLKHLKEMHDHPPSANWSGEVELKEK